MKAAGIKEIKNELVTLPPKQVLELCLRLARFKKENKELLHFLLFEAHDQTSYLEGIKLEIQEVIDSISTNNLFLIKLHLRKILRSINRHCKYMGNKQAQAELLLFFCNAIIQKQLPIHKSPALSNLYKQQLKKIQQSITDLHDDLAFDYQKQLDALKPGF